MPNFNVLRYDKPTDTIISGPQAEQNCRPLPSKYRGQDRTVLTSRKRPSIGFKCTATTLGQNCTFSLVSLHSYHPHYLLRKKGRVLQRQVRSDGFTCIHTEFLLNILTISFSHCILDLLVRLVVMASTSGAEDPGFESRLRRDFFGVESYQ